MNCLLTISGKAINVSPTSNDQCLRTAKGSPYLTFTIPVNLSTRGATKENEKVLWVKVFVFFRGASTGSFDEVVDAAKQRDIPERFDKLNSRHIVALHGTIMPTSQPQEVAGADASKAKPTNPNHQNLAIIAEPKSIMIYSMNQQQEGGSNTLLFS